MDGPTPQRCNICAQQIHSYADRSPEQDHHLDRSPVDPELCLGCWMASVKITVWLIQAFKCEGRTPWDLEIQDLMKELLAGFKAGKYSPRSGRHFDPNQPSLLGELKPVLEWLTERQDRLPAALNEEMKLQLKTLRTKIDAAL